MADMVNRALDNSMYPMASEVPSDLSVACLDANILINGEIERDGFGREEVFAACQQAAIFGEEPIIISGLIDKLVNQICRINLNTQFQR